MVMGGEPNFEGLGLNPSTKYWMDIYSHIFVVELVMFF